jgi:Beta-lactamase
MPTTERARLHGLCQQRLGRLSEVMRGYVERGALAGAVALVARQDAVHVAVVGAQDLDTGAVMRRDTIFRIASMTKPVTAAAAMVLVEETKLRLDDPVERFLPELADRRVLRTIDSPLDDTVPAHRPLTLRDLLTFRLGFGAVMAPPGRYPIQAAVADAGLSPGPNPVPFGPDDHQTPRRPAAHASARRAVAVSHRLRHSWRADRARQRDAVRGFPGPADLRPAGHGDTAFSVPEGKLDRLTTCYQADGTGRLASTIRPAADDGRSLRTLHPAAADSFRLSMISWPSAG